MTFSEMKVGELLEALGSANPTPGGGTAAAIAGAMGTSLLVMVSSLAKSRNNTDEEKEALAKARGAIAPISAQLTRLADADAESYNGVMAAYRLPKATDAEKAARTTAIQAALKGATVVPLYTLRTCAGALMKAHIVAAFGNASAASDTGVAIALLRAAAAGAEANVRANLEGLKDESFRSATAAEVAQLSADAAAAADSAMRALA
jgi:formiminotetrahydrofolate cyclodeaminase